MFFRARKNRRRVDVTARADELKAAARRHASLAATLAGLVVGTGLLALLAVEGWRWATTTPRLALTEIVVRGQERATEAELVKLGGIATGTNLLVLDPGALERALAAHPWVATVAVRRELPSRLVVEVTEHQPRALLALGELYLLDQAGVPFKRLTPSDGADLPLVSGVGRDELLKSRDAALQRLKQGVEIIDAYGRLGSGDALSEVHLGPEGVTLTTSKGQEVRLGEAPLGEALGRLERVRAELKGRALQAEVVRLDDRQRPERVTVQVTSLAGPERGRGSR